MKNLQRAISIGLLIFVAVSLVYLVVGKPGASNTSPVAEDVAVKSNSNGVATVVYYFHRTARCRTCRALESTAKEAIEGAFAEELGSGTLSVESINIEEPSGSQFIEQYQISGPALVLSRMDGPSEVSWKNLDQIWKLIRTPAEYKAYVVSELESFIKAQS